jgi:putative transposase
VVVTEANAPERLFTIACLMEDLEELSKLELIWVDVGYTGENFARVVGQLSHAKVDVTRRSDFGL